MNQEIKMEKEFLFGKQVINMKETLFKIELKALEN